MASFFNDDFVDFLAALNKYKVEYLLVGGYAVILHGYVRSTADMDVWVNKTSANYEKLSAAFKFFGAPIFSQNDFLGTHFDVWSLGREPNRIDIMSEVKGLYFEQSLAICKKYPLKDFEIFFIHLTHLLQAKEAAGRFKDKADIEQLKKRNDLQ